MDRYANHTPADDAVAAIEVFRAPKRGHAPAEYEDAAACSTAAAFPLHAAVADGATESAYAQSWAQRLVTGWVAAAPTAPAAFAAALPAWRAAWQDDVAARTQGQPWYAAAKAEQGAYAALLGLTLQAAGTWQALCVGDCTLFQLRDDALLTAWPFDAPDAFGHRPALVASRPPPSPAAPDAAPDATGGSWRPGDTFLLASDALAAWLLRTGPSVACALDADAFVSRVQAARADGTLRNDDVTLVRVGLRAA